MLLLFSNFLPLSLLVPLHVHRPHDAAGSRQHLAARIAKLQPVEEM